MAIEVSNTIYKETNMQRKGKASVEREASKILPLASYKIKAWIYRTAVLGRYMDRKIGNGFEGRWEEKFVNYVYNTMFYLERYILQHCFTKKTKVYKS